MLKRLACFILVLCLVFCVFSVSAEPSKDGDITIGTVDGLTGDSVIVPITIENNRGIMAVTISITYDSSALEYVEFYKGDVLKDYMVVAHPTKNIIRFVCCEIKDRTNDGTLLSLKFNIAENAEAKLHKIDISYSKGDFCNWDLEKLMPSITAGGVNVAYNGKNCPHKTYGEWTVAAEPSCKENGVNQRVCDNCGHVDLKNTDPIGHEYSDKWTVEEAATADKAGTMVRYCIRCTDFVDKITYTLEQAGDGKIENDIGAEVDKNDYIVNIFEEQNPGESLTPNKPEQNEGSVIDDAIDEIIGSDSETMNNIKDIFPNFDKLLKIFETAITILIILIIM